MEAEEAEEVQVKVSALPLGIKLEADRQGVCRVVMSKRAEIKVGDAPYCLNDQPIPRGLKPDEVEAILQLAQLPFSLVLLRHSADKKGSIKQRMKSLWGTTSGGEASSSTARKPSEDEVNVILGRDEWAPLGMTFQTCSDGSHRIIFVDPDGQGAFGGIKVGDCIVGINYKPLSFGYSHDECVDLIRKTRKPFTLNLVRKKPDEVAGLVGQVKTQQACKEVISAKDGEIAKLRTSNSHKDAEIMRLRATVASLQKELRHARCENAAGAAGYAAHGTSRRIGEPSQRATHNRAPVQRHQLVGSSADMHTRSGPYAAHPSFC